ncbi:undecaprenyl-diphosphatase [uncultured Tolumonas sp.]|uniref:undecaprenyl-diphosphatase n=1 Tax=uncultured Tolumonas sp. TaxID=263765 RepID=UPI002930352E|nr:undecaprenyl-diphosphatase [uncultured Tolumonas sp.]
MVELFNQTLFLLINADIQPNALIVMLAKLMADLPIWLVPSLLIIGWLRGDNAIRQGFLAAALTAVIALSVNQIIGFFWQHPRPFMMGLGHTLISHVADSSFPSDHMTLICAVAFSLLWHPALRKLGCMLLCLSLPVAWARIYLGVHFPLDMIGAMLVTASCAWLIQYQQKMLIEPVFKIVSSLYEWVFSPAIQRGWLK